MDNDRIEIVNFIGGGNNISNNKDFLEITGKKYQSRLIIGSGKFKNFEENLKAINSSGAEIITVAIRRTNISNPNEPRITDIINPKKYTYLPNTAGCYNAEEAIRTLNLAREAGGWNLVKLEVLGDKKTLYPNMIETIKASKILVKEGFKVMAYCSDDPILAKQLEDDGCAAIMPLGSPIGSGLGIQNKLNLKIIIDNSAIPVIVDAGLGTASDACIAMELGCDGVLINSAIALADNPIQMGEAMKLAVKAGRIAYLSGRMNKSELAIASSPKKDF
jgi:thiazole synthase